MNTDDAMSEITVRGELLAAAERIGAWLAKSKMFGIDNAEAGCILALHSLMIGKSPVEVSREYHIIEGKLSMRADAMLAKFSASGGRVEWLRYDDTEARAKFSSPDGGSIEMAYTMEQARRAGLATRGTWQKHPGAMLRARLISSALRMIAPGIVQGLYAPEELEAASPVETVQVQVQAAEMLRQLPAPAAEPASRPLLPDSQVVLMAETTPRERVMARLRDIAGDALSFLQDAKAMGGKAYLSPGQALVDLTDAQIRRIHDGWDVFSAKVAMHAAASREAREAADGQTT